MNKYIWARKLIHFGAAIIPFSYLILPKHRFIILISSLTAIALTIELLRFKNYKFKTLFYMVVGKLLWAKETRTLTSATTFIIGAFICSIFFSKPVVVASLLFLTFGDTLAYLVGNTIGKIKIFGKKTLEGGLTFFLVSIITVALIPGMKFWVGLIGACVACIVELLPWEVDDNLSVPIIAGTLMELILTAL